MGGATREPATGRIVLGSRSPRRLELLSLLVGRERIVVCPPRDPSEPGFEGLRTMESVGHRLAEIARKKNHDVWEHLSADLRADVSAVLTADTVIVVCDECGLPVVLGQPPEGNNWRETVREWFERFLLQRPHVAATAVCASTPDGRVLERLVQTEVVFRAAAGAWLEWYLQTDEPRGKAGGYALQGAGSLFVESIHGSPSNVVGLPLCETADMLGTLAVLST